MDQQPQQLGDFDVRQVTVRDPVTKRIVKQNPYRLMVIEGVSYFEHPKGSGNLWYGDKSPAGRFEKGKIVKEAAHIAWEPPKTEDELLAGQMAAMKQENDKLLLELAEIKKEQQKKAAALPKAQTKSEA